MEKIEKSDKAVLRNKSIGTKVSEDEYAAGKAGRVPHSFAQLANEWA